VPQQQQQQQQLAGSPGLEHGSSGGSGGGGDGGSLLSPAIQSEDMPIKCWEIGPGTAVQDAVAHIVKLSSQAQQPNRPQSPGKLPRGMAGGGGVGGKGGLMAGIDVAGDDSRSEIRHDDSANSVLEAATHAAVAAAGAAGGAAATPPQPPLLQLPQDHQHQQAQQQQQQQQTPISSGASTPRSRMGSRRPSLARPSLDGGSGGGAAGASIPRSPSQLLADSGSSLRSYALRSVEGGAVGGPRQLAAWGHVAQRPRCWSC
jgi:hypothetical protein